MSEVRGQIMKDEEMPEEVTKAISNILKFLEKSEKDFLDERRGGNLPPDIKEDN